LGAVAGAALGWGWFEAGWVRLRTLDVTLPGLPRELAGVRLAHLSDFHLGPPSRGRRAAEEAVAWAAAREPDLVLVTGDLVSHPRGEPLLRELLAKLPRCYAILGNHDVESSRDPFSRSAGLQDLSPARLLVDESETIDLRGLRVQIAGIDPRTYRRGARPERLVDPDADLRILLSHYPRVLDRLSPDAFHLVLAGHMHDGQITVPYAVGKLRLAHPSAPYWTGIYKGAGATTMHVSPGLGTTFVPFRFFARPEATELVLQRA
jgi:predicted MPP superfamily phosphohydrolase